MSGRFLLYTYLMLNLFIKYLYENISLPGSR